MGMAAPIYYTADMVPALPDDGNRYEVVYGELLVTPAPKPWHEIVQRRLMYALETYLRRIQWARCWAPGPTSPGLRTRWSRPTFSSSHSSRSGLWIGPGCGTCSSWRRS